MKQRGAFTLALDITTFEGEEWPYHSAELSSRLPAAVTLFFLWAILETNGCSSTPPFHLLELISVHTSQLPALYRIQNMPQGSKVSCFTGRLAYRRRPSE